MSPTTSTPDPLDDCRWTISGPLSKLPIEMLPSIFDFLPPRDLLALLRAFPMFAQTVTRKIAHIEEDGISILHLLAATSDKTGDSDVALLDKLPENSNPMGAKGNSPLSHAILSKNERAMEALLRRKDVDATSCCPLLGNQTPLIYVILQEEKKIIDFLLDREGVNVAQPNPCGRTPLSYAAEKGDAVLTKRLLPHYTDIGHVDDEGRAAISYAAAAGSNEVVELLLSQHGANADQVDEGGITPLLYAYAAGSKEVAELLLSQHGVNANRTGRGGWTPIFFACYGGSKEIVELLLSQDNVKADQADAGGCTPIFFACCRGSKEVVELLLSQDGVEADQADGDGRTLLSYAAENGNKEVVELLLSQDNVKADQADAGGFTPLSYAVEEQHEEVVRLLTKPDLYPGGKDDYCQEPLLSRAVGKGNEKIVELLLPRPNVDAETRTSSNRLALFSAVKKGSAAMVKLLLLQPNVHADERDDMGRTPLSYAAERGVESVARLLLDEYSVSAHSRCHRGKSPLGYAAASGNAEVISLLLNRGREADLGDDVSMSLVALAQHHPETLVPELVHDGNTDVNYADDYGNTALFWASKSGSTPLVELLLSHPNINIDKPVFYQTPLVEAIREEHEDTVMLLLKHGADPHSRFIIDDLDPFHDLPLVHAARRRSPRVVRLLLDCYNKKSNKATSDFCLGLYHAVTSARPQAVKMLLDQLNGRVPMPEGRLLRQLPMLSELVRTQFARIHSYRTEAQRQVLCYGHRRNHELVVNTMLGNRDDELANMDKESPFYIALRCQVFVAQMLLDRADAGPGWSRYHFPWSESRATFAEYEDIVRKLLARRDEQTAQLRRDNLTPLPWAAADPELESYFHVVWHLLHAPQPAVNIVDRYGLTELLYALGGGRRMDTTWLF
ncbi:Ankyrin repeat protein [Metarhizium guizhouense ARSEF 977]|uniref:Ankyrin repeat protein n=1 Tax=Metarhizium guizhouense (strain ARSEF 977) TaxID=1276136 RepID=A0A0B4GUM4_METGA|nr:Ankyrin repeat protein [Metarhizium guizhouense ARSEF 977]